MSRDASIEKQPHNYRYTSYDENGKSTDGKDNILKHAQSNSEKFLGSIFTILRYWAENGRQRKECEWDLKTFNHWSQVGNWIVNEVFGLETDLLKDYDLITKRISSASMSHLRTIGSVCFNL